MHALRDLSLRTRSDQSSAFAGADCRIQNLGSVLPQHPPQVPGAFPHAQTAELRQPHRARGIPIADADRRSLSRALVPQPKGLPGGGFALELGKPRRLALTLSFASSGKGLERSTQIDRSFFEHLLANLCPPHEPRFCFAHPRIFGALPGVERIDQIEARPRDLVLRGGVL